MRFLAWLILAVLVIYVVRKKMTAAMRPPPPASPEQARRSVEGEAMISCAHCGIYIPASEALAGPHDQLYCSPEHRALHVSS
ncbi:PP0621 family protein [Actimicrobium sp. CCI2.3]|uniref:PP0621 family protein n=1 Tax=Actimicrobium sp. CCI2.3 TaxID=3048616 RepID=UPI002AB39FF1|nr:PP0621 family protein [Actimicrobium sp. CCI2.3]MDY7573585.1 PP0621 family protein [Actimicrobium sp. CCI2.3]MEB0022099.1 PP0621 family protein [Actimicrobium sp. CCI2.3]